MIDYLRHHLGAKLLLSYLTIIIVGIVILILASQFVLPATFNHHMLGMGMMNGMMGGQTADNPEVMSTLYTDFRASFNEALIYAALAATIVAVALSIYLSRSVIAPLHAMSIATQDIAEGHYDKRVQVQGEDELAQLATRFNQMAAKLDQVESMRQRLIGDVSHELRTPLTAIKGSMEGLMDGVLPADHETFFQIHAEADRLNRLVDDLQELSRVEAHAYELDLRPLDVSLIAKTVAKRLASQFESKHIALHLDVDPGLPPAFADEDRAVQVLTNLTGNALQYTPEDGKVTISARQINNEIHISVHDTGVGIPAEHLQHVFDRFYRVDKSRSRSAGGGSGIGLTIARALVEAQGGKLQVESLGNDMGSTFTFTMKKAP
jgi:two-component system sensor histidine kinase BaeS